MVKSAPKAKAKDERHSHSPTTKDEGILPKSKAKDPNLSKVLLPRALVWGDGLARSRVPMFSPDAIIA